MAKWLAKEFDWDTGRYTGNYYNIAQAGIVAVFVDSFYGLDTNAGTAVAPFKTLSKAITTLNTTGADGSRIFMNGIFSENLPAPTYWYEFIGCGGGWNDKVIFYQNTVMGTKPTIRVLSKYHNIRTINYGHTTIFPFGALNNNRPSVVGCIFTEINVTNSGTADSTAINTFYTVFYNCIRATTYGGGYSLFGDSNIIFDCTRESGPGFRVTSSLSNTYCNNTFLAVGGINNLYGIEAQFINPANLDFNVRITSPLLGAGTLDEITSMTVNVGGVALGLPYNGFVSEFSSAGGATITDLTIDANGKLTIIPPSIRGTLESALMDLGNIYPLENIDVFNVFDFAAGQITQGVYEDFVSPRMALTIKLKYGLKAADVDACPWLLIEYGKQPTFSGTGVNRVGNAADTYDPATSQEITCRYMKLFVTLQNNS